MATADVGRGSEIRYLGEIDSRPRPSFKVGTNKREIGRKRHRGRYLSIASLPARL